MAMKIKTAIRVARQNLDVLAMLVLAGLSAYQRRWTESVLWVGFVGMAAIHALHRWRISALTARVDMLAEILCRLALAREQEVRAHEVNVSQMSQEIDRLRGLVVSRGD